MKEHLRSKEAAFRWPTQATCGPCPSARSANGDERKGVRPAQRLSASGRGLLWRFLAGTGLRLNEARGLAVGHLILVGDRPGIDLSATIIKAKRRRYVPQHPELAERLRHHVAGRKPKEPVFAVPADILKRFKADCRRAGIALIDERGRTLDVHDLRMSFTDRLVKANVSPRIVQEFARHSDLSLTMRQDTDIRVHDRHAAIAFAAPSVAPTEVKTGATEIFAGNPPSSVNSPRVLDLLAKRRVSW